MRREQQRGGEFAAIDQIGGPSSGVSIWLDFRKLRRQRFAHRVQDLRTSIGAEYPSGNRRIAPLRGPPITFLGIDRHPPRIIERQWAGNGQP